jgi:late competence protein required for DNA uptake (superfamily II DNA/RNA helicase)
MTNVLSDRQGEEMDHWALPQWKQYMMRELQQELEGEASHYSRNSSFSEREMWMWEFHRGADMPWEGRDATDVEGCARENEGISNMLKIKTLWDELGRTLESGRQVGDIGSSLVMQKLAKEADVLVAALRGRSLLAAEVNALMEETSPVMVSAWFTAAQLAYLQGQLVLGAGVAPAPAPSRGAPWRRREAPRCRRCGSEALGRTACASCGSAACAYCEACLALGRSRACTLLLRTAAGPAVRGAAGGYPTEAMGRWGLSAAQAHAACAALRFLALPPMRGATAVIPTEAKGRWGLNVAQGPARFLLWAVTGAGKTEMIFPLLDSILQVGGRVLVATPRRDVVLELAPRLAKAFPDESVVTLYGGSTERWRPGSLTLATTHQLMRFYQAFDLVVIDELDAFPYHNDPMLAFAAYHACKPTGKFVYLSATPPQALQREVVRGTVGHARVPVRFHGHPLPVPKRVSLKSLAQCIRKPILLRPLFKELKHSLHRGAQVFVFVSRIRHIQPLVEKLRTEFNSIEVEGTSSVDPLRGEKVMAFRQTTIRLLVTTTILERGVTVPKSDVYVVDADSDLFDEASLVQMAGRAGRSSSDPAGAVVFASSEWTRSQRRAISQIKTMNRIARKKGYLHKNRS